MVKKKKLVEVEEDEEEEMETPEDLPTRDMKSKQSTTVEATEIVKETELGFKLPDGEIVTKDGLLLWMAQQIFEVKKAVA